MEEIKEHFWHRNWKFEVYSYEISVTALKEENRTLKKELFKCTVEKNATIIQLEKLEVHASTVDI